MSFASKSSDFRTYDQVRQHYEIEKELANRLRSASKEQRRHLYTDLYNELFIRVPHHPQHARKASPVETATVVGFQKRFIERFLTADSMFMEIGPGDCSVSKEISKLAKKVYAVDVSSEITKNPELPSNFNLIISDGTSVDVDGGSIDVVYSNQLMEHLHPDDAIDQLKNIYKALCRGGVYICITPNRLTGPHDVSKYFQDEVATGFHLKEYTTNEMNKMCMEVGFAEFRVYIPIKGDFFRVPLFVVALNEKMLELLPYKIRRLVLKIKVFRLILGSVFVGFK